MKSRIYKTKKIGNKRIINSYNPLEYLFLTIILKPILLIIKFVYWDIPKFIISKSFNLIKILVNKLNKKKY